MLWLFSITTLFILLLRLFQLWLLGAPLGWLLCPLICSHLFCFQAHPCFLALEDASRGLLCIFSAPALESDISSRSSVLVRLLLLGGFVFNKDEKLKC